MSWKDWFQSVATLFYPKTCIVCGSSLSRQEAHLCARCSVGLPRTNLHLVSGNEAEKLFWGKVDVQRVSAYFYYQRGSDYRSVLRRLKYEGEQEVGVTMGRQMARELLQADFFEGIDCLLPVPLHKKKQRIRGYNQSVCIAQGISEVTGVPVIEGAVTREKNTETQTRKSALQRWENVEGIFKLQNAEPFEGKHVLIIDDVLTTGSTCVACADALQGVARVKLSVLTLAMVK